VIEIAVTLYRVSFEDFIQKSMKGLLGLGFKDFWAYYPTTLFKKMLPFPTIATQGKNFFKLIDY
jgi:hypothetical protein